MAHEALTPNQVARRERVLDAALALASEGGYDAVQMRDVATRAQVALGTIYRYFSSKDHLLTAAQLKIWRDLAAHLARRPPEGATAADRVVAVVRTAMRAAEREPRRTAALVTASSSPDPAVRAAQVEIMEIMDGILVDAMGDLDPDRKRDVARALRHVWFATLLGWVNDWTDASAVSRDLEIAARLMLR